MQRGIVKTFYIVESSHLFRAGDKFKTQFFVMDVVNFLRHHFFSGEAETIVLHGSVKEEQAVKYSSALERHGVKVIRMKPIVSEVDREKSFYKPAFYLHRMMGAEIPKGSHICFIGFHNVRYIKFIEKYAKDFNFSLAAFTTPSKKQGWMTIPEEFQPYLKHSIPLDEHVTAIKAEFKRKSK
jgi:hypothetical protein